MECGLQTVNLSSNFFSIKTWRLVRGSGQFKQWTDRDDIAFSFKAHSDLCNSLCKTQLDINFSNYRSPGLVVMGRDSHSEGCGFKSRHRILDGHFSHIIVVK